jgi:predicted amidophosphoribosyltransferase
VLLLKCEPVFPLGEWFADRLAQIVQSRPADFAADVVIPGLCIRSENAHADTIKAGLIARPPRQKAPFAVPAHPFGPHPEKELLTEAERWESVRGAFATQTGTRVDNLRVLLVDDVMTTGATLDACTRAWRDAGAKEVIGLTVARAVRNSQPHRGVSTRDT